SQTGEVIEAFFAFDPAFTGGVFVAVQDVNSDGILDIIASAGPGGGPEVRIFDGTNLSLLRSFFAYDQSFTGGVSVASVDLNNDGTLDLVTGAGPGGGPHVKVFDGATGNIISQWFAYPISFTGGVFVAVGDIGNDGTIEVVTGAGAGGAPVVAVWDPFTGALLAQFMAYAEDFTGGVRVGINDGNTDGIADILTGAGPGGGPQVNVFDFPGLNLLLSFYSGDPANTGGVFVG
ncbi:MAG: FG-GAP-like repeat-containing protein, partial [Planctomycetia bacterium]